MNVIATILGLQAKIHYLINYKQVVKQNKTYF